MPWQSNVFPYIIITGSPPHTGLYVYTPTPGKNNLVETVGITTGGTDSFGNTILAGDTLYMNQAGTYYALQIAGGAGSVPLIHWWISSGDQTGTYSTMFVVGAASGATASLGIDLGSAAPFGNPPQCFSQPLHAQNPVTPASGAETWHSLGTLANYSIVTARYSLSNANEVRLQIDVSSSGANAGTTTFANTLPGAYIPATANPNGLHLPLASTRVVTAADSWPRLFISSTGQVQIVQTAAVNNTLGTAVSVPLD